ncbi:MAG TPA: YraN family protein [Gammaproteobacteria bacterium]|nr:YraN family protein [Gammaproteobacteria bacterium]
MPGTTSKQASGNHAEDLACDYLQRHGLRLIQRNYRCRRGEIDLVMRHRQHTVFVEVRYRRSNRFGSAAESVDARKQAKLLAAAEHYLQHNPKAARGACRFDVVALSTENNQAQIHWIENAFQA